MSDPADYEATDPVLPGLEPPAVGESALELAARQTIRQLESLGLLDDRHAVLCRLMLDMAAAAAVGVRTGKASAAAMAGAQVLAAYQLMMPEAVSGGESDEWTQLVAELRRSGTELRNALDPGA